jgi:hypothetical protein
MWRFEFSDAVVYRFRDWTRSRAGLLLFAASIALMLAGSLAAPILRFALLGASLLVAGVGALVLFRMRNLVIDRTRRLLLLEDRRPFRQTLRRIFSLDCVRLRLEMASLKWGKDPYQSLWIEDQCDGRKLKLLERSSSLRCDTSRLESDLGRPLLVVVRS